jgi:hypothetical protein
LKWDCQNQHNTTFFDKCCHPLLNGESMSVLENLGCNVPEDECDDGDSSASPSSTSSTPPKAAQASAHPESKPASGALAKADDTPPASTPSPTPTTSPTPTPSPTTPAYTPPKSSSSPPPAQTSGSGDGGENTGGIATYFYQNGVAGFCGKVNPDSAMICAMDSIQYDKDENICGKSVSITNTDTGKNIVVVVADKCPTCINADSIDLSTEAFKVLSGDNLSKGTVPIKWNFIN